MSVIRAALSSDIAWMSEQLKEFARVYDTLANLLPPTNELKTRLEALIAEHPVLVAEVDGKSVGFIAGLLLPHFLNSLVVQLTELFWWVEEEHRASVGGWLLEEFVARGRELGAHMVTVSLIAGSEHLSVALEAFGFHLHESNYLMELN